MEYKNFKKKFGQNFLTDTNLLKSIVSDAEVQSTDVVVEIGAGAGALTKQLAAKAKRVVAFEIDKELEPILSEIENEHGNVQIIYDDFLNFNEENLAKLAGKDFIVVANLPYYITSPIISKLFSLKNRPRSITVMVQKEVGERMVATEKNGDYGFFSALVSLNTQAKITRIVSRKMFTPAPNVDSCVVHLKLKSESGDEGFIEFLKASFQMKRKTLVNNLEKAGYKTKAELINILEGLSISSGARADGLDINKLRNVYNALKNKN